MDTLDAVRDEINYIFIVKDGNPVLIYNKYTFKPNGGFRLHNFLKISDYININDNDKTDSKVLLSYSKFEYGNSTISDYQPFYSIGIFYKKDLIDMMSKSWRMPIIFSNISAMHVKNVDDSDYVFVSTISDDMDKIIKKVNKVIKKLLK